MVAQDLARLAHAAMIARDWAVLRPLLHPYLHWTRGDGTIVRGRSNVLAMLARGPAPPPPTSVELRDGQIYRWRSGAGTAPPIAGDTLGRPPTH
jgi:hypothetical protein